MKSKKDHRRPLPQWHREALERGIRFIVLTYDKAEGFVFCPTDLDHPFRVGGDYDGSFGATADDAIGYFNKYFHQAYVDRVDWFIPFLEKIQHGEDFSLDDLQLHTRDVRLIERDWPW